MKLFIKITFGLAVAFILLIVGLIIFFPKEKIKNYALEKIQAQTELPIKIGDVGLSVFPSFAFHLKSFEIGSDKHMIHASVDDFQIQTSIETLWGKDINITNISIIKPIIKVYTSKLDETESKSTEDQEPKTASTESKDFSISKFLLEDGEIWIFDKQDEEEFKIINLDQNIQIEFTDAQNVHVKGKTSASEIWAKELHMPGISLAINKDITFNTKTSSISIQNSSFVIQDLPMFLQGNISPMDDTHTQVDIAIKTAPTELSDIFSLVPSLKADDWKKSGLFSVDGSVQGEFDHNDFLTSFEKSKTNIKINLEKGALQNKAYQVNFSPVEMEATITPLSVKLHKLHITSDRSVFRADAMVSDYLHTPHIRSHITANANLADLQAWIDKNVLSKLQGSANLDVTIDGTTDIDKLNFTGSLTLADTSFTEPSLKYNISGLHTKVTLTESQTLLENTKLSIEKSDFSIPSAKCSPWKDFLNDKKPITFDFSGSSKLIQYDDVLPASSEEESDPNAPLVMPDIFYRFDGKGSYAVDKIIYNDTPFTNVKAGFTLKNGKMNFNPLSVGTFDGVFSAKGSVDFGPKDHFPFDMDVALNDISVQKALAFTTSVEQLVRLKQSLSAKVNLTTKAKGDLTNTLNLEIPKLTALGNFGVKDASLKNHPIQDKLSSYLSASEFKEFNVKKWTQNFEVKDGKVHVKDLNLAAKDFVFKLDGYQALDGSQKYNLGATLPESYKNKIMDKIPSQVSSLFFKSNQSKFTIPFSIGGSYASPTLSLNEGNIEDQAKENAKDKVKQDVNEKKSEAKKEVKEKLSPKKEEAKEKAKEEVKDVGKKIKKLF
ncbi:MAG: hypothetical protein KDD46_02865 [Bdellovibrionales bacterium]|nr:hypothetical protein [Bdellovibrionales bacterium]